MILFGTNYGGFKLPDELELDENSVVYCVGVGEDVSFDVALSYETNSTIHMFDPTPRAVEHVKLIQSFLDDTVENRPDDDIRYGGGDKNYLNYLEKHRVESNKLIFHEEGVFTEDTKTKFYEPMNKEFVSHSIIKKNMSEEYIEVKMKKLSTIMKELNHDHIDLLKLDIEGVECDVLIQMFEENIFPKYICVDFDSIRNNLIPKDRMNECMDKLKSYSYKILDNTRLDITFVREV